jgi:hypothetical protein
LEAPRDRTGTESSFDGAVARGDSVQVVGVEVDQGSVKRIPVCRSGGKVGKPLEREDVVGEMVEVDLAEVEFVGVETETCPGFELPGELDVTEVAPVSVLAETEA